MPLFNSRQDVFLEAFNPGISCKDCYIFKRNKLAILATCEEILQVDVDALGQEAEALEQQVSNLSILQQELKQENEGLKEKIIKLLK